MLLESKGFKSGLPRSTPLFAVRIQDHVLVSTGRGKRSLWVKNLTKTPRTRYWLAGRPRNARAIVIVQSRALRIPPSLPASLRTLAQTLHRFAGQGWAFAILAPVSSPS